MMGRNASVCCWFRWTTVLGIDRVWNGIIASNRGELEERGLCTCVSRDPDWIAARAHTHMHAHTLTRTNERTHKRAIMISSSLGRCTSAAQRGGNITFLFWWKCGNKDIVFLFMLLFHLLSHGITFILHYNQPYNTSYLRCKMTLLVGFEYFKDPSPPVFHEQMLWKHLLKSTPHLIFLENRLRIQSSLRYTFMCIFCNGSCALYVRNSAIFRMYHTQPSLFREP